jgi:ABC-type glutathione transport system ATPase component
LQGDTVISTRSLTKDFVVSRSQTVHAVRGISLEVEPGEVPAGSPREAVGGQG